MRIAIPVLKRRLATNFKDFEQVILLDTEKQKIKEEKRLTCPISQPWILPLWFKEHHVDLLIAYISIIQPFLLPSFVSFL